MADTISLTSPVSYLTSFAVGVLLHLFLFRFGEWDLYTLQLISGTILLQGAATFALWHLGGPNGISVSEAARVVGLLLGSVAGGIYTSILVYRAAFHRLNRFPGPFLARLSNFYITSVSLRNFHLFREVQALHAKYGDIVRIGPTEISIANPKAYHAIHSNQSPCEKGPWYNILYPVRSLHMIRNHKDHALRRRTWDRGLGAKALRDYEPRVEDYTQQLLSLLKRQEDGPVNASQVFNFYSFDVMGDMAFGKGFNMLKDGVVHYYMAYVHENMLAVGIFSHLLWVFPLFKTIPGLNNQYITFQKWIAEQVAERKAKTEKVSDLFSWILADYNALEKPTRQHTDDLRGDAHLIVVAGSDTTSAGLTCLFFELAQHPDVLKKLHEEVDQYFAENERVSATTLSKLEYLNACINEGLRLHPPVPSGVQRLTPPEGLQLDGIYIPGNTIVQAPTYTLHRDERCFARPNEFLPERWTTQPELVRDASVFTPFGTGRYGCAGKQLALMEMRSVTSQVVRRYNVRLAPGQDPAEFLQGQQDGFTLASPKLELLFENRNPSQEKKSDGS